MTIGIDKLNVFIIWMKNQKAFGITLINWQISLNITNYKELSKMYDAGDTKEELLNKLSE